MNERERSERISYAMDFASFLISDADMRSRIKSIILFGSTVRGDFDEESDIDIFIEVFETKAGKEVMERINRMHGLFVKSKKHETWKLKGIKYDVSPVVGVLEKWKLRASVYSDGIILYGKYKPAKERLRGFTLFHCSTGKKEFKNKISIWRKLYGYTYRKKTRTYKYQGLIEKFKGKRIAMSVFIIPAEFSNEMIENLNGMGVKYTVFEIWSESLL